MAIILHRKPASLGTPLDIGGGAHDSNKENCTLQMVILYLHIIIQNKRNEHNPSEIKGRTQRREGVK